jgi:hypothetical protein
MAEENITESAKAVSEAMLQVQRDLAQFGRVTQATAEQLKDAQMKAKYGVENFTKGTNTAGQALAALAGAGIEGAKAMYQGKKDATAFNASLGELTKAAALAATALTLLMPGGAIVKGLAAGFALLTSATVGYLQAANVMNAKLFKSYEGLQKSGAAASDGMTGVFKDAKKLGLSMDELDSFVGLVADNSQELALLTGSVAQGRKKFADMGEALESSRVGFFAMGISQQEQNEGMMRYVKNMTLAGRAQNLTTKELTDGARAYIYEQDKLTKLTGISAQKQQAILDRARESEQFNSKIRQLERKGDQESLAVADGLRKGLIMAAGAGEGVADGFMAAVNKNLVNPATRRLFVSSYGTLFESIDDIFAGVAPEKALMKLFNGMADFERTQGNLLSNLEAGNGKFIKSSEQANAALIAEIGYDKAMEKIRADTLTQQKGLGDAITAEEARQIKERQDQNRKMEESVFKGIANAQAVNAKLLGVTNNLSDAFSKLTDGINKLLNIVGLGVEEDKVAQTNKEIDDVKKELSIAKINQEKAKTDNEKIAADREVKFYTEKQKALEIEKKNLLEDEKNNAYEKEVIKRANDDLALKKAAYERQMKTATFGQRMGIGQDKAQKESYAAMIDAETKASQLGIIGSTTRGAAVAELKASGFKPTEKKRSGGGASPEEVLQFTGDSGSRANFDKLNESMKTSLLSAGQQYFEQTGQKLQMNSGFRSFEDQHRLYEETKKAGREGVSKSGYPVAPPGRSSHETGNAVDIQNFSDPKAFAALSANGLRQTVPNDPVHFAIQAADGGVFSGPDSGYPAALHGEEAVIPLNNGGGNFVKIFEDMAMMMGKQVGAMDELIRVAKNGNDIQTKILRQQA